MHRIAAAATAALFAFVCTPSNAGDSLQCHKVKDSQKFKGAVVLPDADETQFDLPTGCTLTGKAAEYCAPASVTVTSPGDAPVPPVAPDGADIANAVLCYKMKCPETLVAPSSVTDAFGFRELVYKNAGKICVPVAQGAVTTTTTTTTTTVVPPCTDVDGDGWSECDGDCCQAASASCGDAPQFVNPGALEVVGNGIDDDCDAATSDSSAASPCSATPSFSVTPNLLAQALDICQTTTANPPIAQRKWGLISASMRLANGNASDSTRLTQQQTFQSAVLADYGTVITPQKDATMVGLSTGRMRDQTDSGYIAPVSGADFAHDSTPPSSWFAANGSSYPTESCSGVCSTASDANDSVNLRLSLRVPTNATSLSFRTRYFVADFSSYHCTVFNDAFLALLTSTAAGNPADTNIGRDSFGNTLTANDMFYEVCSPMSCHTCPLGTADLNGTGLSPGGGGTGWITMSGAVTPGETIQLELMVFDVGDNIDDSIALLDDFQWGLADGVELPEP